MGVQPMGVKEQIRAALESAAAIAKRAVDEKRGLSEQENTEIAVFEKRAADLKSQLAAEERAESLRVEAGKFAATPAHQDQRQNTDQPADQQQQQQEQREQVHFSTVDHKEEKGDALGCLMHARMRFGTDQRAAEAWAKKTYGERSPQARAMQASNFTSGGAVIGGNFVGSELIELLRAKSVFRMAGARSIRLVGGSATIPKITGGSSAYWGDEGDNITASELTTGNVKLQEKKLTALVPFSNDLGRNSDLAVDRMIRDDMVRSAANAEELAFFRGAGTANTPKGIYHWVTSANRHNTAGATLANIRTDVRTAKKSLGNQNAPFEKRAWFMHSQAQDYVGTEIVDANSNLVWPAMADGMGAKWNGGTVYPTNNIPLDLSGGVSTTGGVQSELYLIEMTEVFIGDSLDLELEVFANATYVDANGNLRSGISRDESVVRLIRKMDFAMRHIASGHVTEQLTWGN